MASSFYNGYSPSERSKKSRAGDRLRASGKLKERRGPCELCGDPNTPVEAHSEDYAAPYSWDAPAVRMLCRACHRDKLHKRFRNPAGWEAFKVHVRRGGYSRDLRQPEVEREFRLFKAGKLRRSQLKRLRQRQLSGNEWWEKLSTRKRTLKSRSARMTAERWRCGTWSFSATKSKITAHWCR